MRVGREHGTYIDAAPEVAANPVWADPGVISISRGGVKFNSLDNECTPPVDRESAMGAYEVVQGLPLNPKGRTGIAGRGMLGRWGPNQRVTTVFTR